MRPHINGTPGLILNLRFHPAPDVSICQAVTAPTHPTDLSVSVISPEAQVYIVFITKLGKWFYIRM